MNILNTRYVLVVVTLTGFFSFSVCALTADHDHDHQEDKHYHHVDVNLDNDDTRQHKNEYAVLNEEQRRIVGIEIAEVKKTNYQVTQSASAEVKANGYTSYIVSPRTDSVVVNRHVTLGDKVSQGQKLVTLFSQEVASAQAEYRLARSEWLRMAKLTGTAVSESEKLAGKTRFDAAYGQLIALGLSDSAIKSLHSLANETLGEYALIAQQVGVVLNDDFSQGQRVEAGYALMMLADESTLWVEAKLPVKADIDPHNIDQAEVLFKGRKYAAEVIQQTHTIDPITRTKVIRLSVDNKDDVLHAGMFVEVQLTMHSTEQAMLVPESAVVRDQAQNWVVFVEQSDGALKPVQIRLGAQIGKHRVIYGLDSPSRLAVRGAFFIASELAKSNFDPHNH
ncbi:efflux RND transporter periplasmic adaptor subunit [Pseudoalteromonas umbrosa]|uniref:efflux RND transporter periplasmic adaptor subunit n=1 Tax=Pseudoalteromonas umbrosa TaxID=3048489 RepID=UPI0024C424C1|nr:efflux RND transporter periplasmic adaptor subunit [Pseudoalteromonas sp. B95]MDK1289379.1 efflux RND transporter periplasmic adaptor subunit [Pseudoalteromonas sp. B95]